MHKNDSTFSAVAEITIQYGLTFPSYLSHQGKNICSLFQTLIKVFSSLSGIGIFTRCHIYPGFQDYPLNNTYQSKFYRCANMTSYGVILIIIYTTILYV